MKHKGDLLDNLTSRSERDTLAADIARSDDRDARIGLLMSTLLDESADLHNVMKVLQRIAELLPALLLDRTEQFAGFLSITGLSPSAAKRLMWGSMCILDEIATVDPRRVGKHLNVIANATDTDSIVAKDHAVSIFAKLSTDRSFHESCLALLIDMVRRAPVNQFPSYAETTADVIAKADEATQLKHAILGRMHEDIPEAKLRRLERVCKRLHSMISNGS